MANQWSGAYIHFLNKLEKSECYVKDLITLDQSKINKRFVKNLIGNFVYDGDIGGNLLHWGLFYNREETVKLLLKSTALDKNLPFVYGFRFFRIEKSTLECAKSNGMAKLLKKEKFYLVNPELELDKESISCLKTQSVQITLFIPQENFTFYDKRRSDDESKVLKSYHGSSWQIAEYRYKTQIWVGKIPCQPPIDLVREVLGARVYKSMGVEMATTSISFVCIMNENINLLQPPENRYAIMSRKYSNFQILDDKFLCQITSKDRIKNLTVLHCGRRVPLLGFWELAAIAKWIGDIDFVGASGTNIGFKMLENINIAVVKKIDPGYFGEGFNRSIINENIQFSSHGGVISFALLNTKSKIAFLKAIQVILSTDDNFIRKMFEISLDGVPEDITRRVDTQVVKDYGQKLISRREELRNVFAKHLA